MSVVLWVLQGVLALAFAGAGLMKLTSERKVLVDKGQGWAAHATDGQVKLVGAAEVLGALGLVLPAALGIVPVLTPIAALALAATMIGAVVVHVRMRDAKGAVPAGVLAVLSLVVGIGRFLV